MKSYWIDCKKNGKTKASLYVIEDRGYNDLMIIDMKKNKSWREIDVSAADFVASLRGEKKYDEVVTKGQWI